MASAREFLRRWRFYSDKSAYVLVNAGRPFVVGFDRSHHHLHKEHPHGGGVSGAEVADGRAERWDAELVQGWTMDLFSCL